MQTNRLTGPKSMFIRSNSREKENDFQDRTISSFSLLRVSEVQAFSRKKKNWSRTFSMVLLKGSKQISSCKMFRQHRTIETEIRKNTKSPCESPIRIPSRPNRRWFSFHVFPSEAGRRLPSPSCLFPKKTKRWVDRLSPFLCQNPRPNTRKMRSKRFHFQFKRDKLN